MPWKAEVEIAATKLGDSLREAGAKSVSGKRKSTARSGVTNGRDVLPGVDGRSIVARRYFDIQAALTIDQGGADQISEARLQLIRRFAASAVLAEQMGKAMRSTCEVFYRSTLPLALFHSCLRAARDEICVSGAEALGVISEDIDICANFVDQFK